MRDGARLFAMAILLAVLAATYVRTFVVQGLAIPTSSMTPGLLPGDHVLFNRLVFQPPRNAVADLLLPLREIRRGDVVVVRDPRSRGRLLVKRVDGLAGDTVSLDDAPPAHTNGPQSSRPVGDSGPDRRRAPQRPRTRSFRVPYDHVFLTGDHRERSIDSRHFGSIPRDAVLGRVVLVYWSFDSPGSNRPTLPRRLAGTRWQRMFQPVR